MKKIQKNISEKFPRTINSNKPRPITSQDLYNNIK